MGTSGLNRKTLHLTGMILAVSASVPGSVELYSFLTQQLADAHDNPTAAGIRSIFQTLREMNRLAVEILATLHRAPGVSVGHDLSGTGKYFTEAIQKFSRYVEDSRTGMPHVPESKKEELRKLYADGIETSRQIVQLVRTYESRRGNLIAARDAITRWLGSGSDPALDDQVIEAARPAVIEREPDNVHVSWDNGKQTASLDRWSGGKLEWFFMDRETSETEGSDGALITSLPTVFFDLLQAFV
jgi:hypothetical protein